MLVSDAVIWVDFLFSISGSIPQCLDAADVTGDSHINIADAIYLLTWLFVPVAPPPPGAFPQCALDDWPDVLSCEFYPCP
ncbi:MAG: hypothetical protein ACKVX7_03015 [Planctomycetota bacterium]